MFGGDRGSRGKDRFHECTENPKVKKKKKELTK
jgi:hypothetical protein